VNKVSKINFAGSYIYYGNCNIIPGIILVSFFLKSHGILKTFSTTWFSWYA